MLILGIDDAGRGPIIGPMVLAGVLISYESEAELKALGVKDSKAVLQNSRVKIAKSIKSIALDSKVVLSTPEEIDSSILSGTNLNTLEAIKTAEIINYITKNHKSRIKVVVDCPSVNIKAWTATLLKYVKEPDNLEVTCEHKADVNHVAVSAASILAKTTREEQVDKIKEKYGNMGSGYPADPFTKEFLIKRGKELENSGIFRKSWQTWKTLFGDPSEKDKQAKLF